MESRDVSRRIHVPQYWNHAPGPAPAKTKIGATSASDRRAGSVALHVGRACRAPTSAVITAIKPKTPPPTTIRSTEIARVSGVLFPASHEPRWRIHSRIQPDEAATAPTRPSANTTLGERCEFVGERLEGVVLGTLKGYARPCFAARYSRTCRFAIELLSSTCEQIENIR